MFITAVIFADLTHVAISHPTTTSTRVHHFHFGATIMSTLTTPLFRKCHSLHKCITLNPYSLLQSFNGIGISWQNHGSILDGECTQNADLNGYSVNTIFSEGLLFAKKGPGTSARKHSKCKTRKRMSRVGFLARVRTYNGRKILQRQRAKGRRFLGARLT